MKFRITTLLLILCTLAGRNGIACSDSLMFRILEIERHVMQAEDETIKASWLLQKSLLYKGAGNYQEAFSSLQRIDVTVLSSGAKDSLHYQKAFNLFMLGSFDGALQEMRSIQDRQEQNDPNTLLFLMVLLENEHWDEFKQAYLKLAKEKHADTITFLASFQPPVVMDAERYDRLAKIPGLGLGLTKAGYTGRGLTSASLQLLLAGVGVWQIATGYYFTGVFSGLLPARRFYHGGKVLTSSMVARSNEKQIAALKQLGYTYINALE